MRCPSFVAVVLSLLLAQSSSAARFEYTFVGQITEVLSAIPGGPGLFETVTGTFAYEDGLTSSASPIGGEIFYDAGSTVEFTVNGFAPSSALSRMIVNNDSFMLGDRFAVIDQNPFDDSSLTFIDASGSVFDSNDIPTALSFGDWDSIVFSLDTPGPGRVIGVITSIVPEPGTGMLLALGLVGLAARRRRQA